MMDPVLSVRDLRTYFHTPEGTVKAVNGISYDLYPGQTLGIVGESGCGKSVHALSILGLIPTPPGKIEGGQILFKPDANTPAKDLAGAKTKAFKDIRGVKIAMIFQEPMTSLNPVLTIGEQIAESIRFHAGASHDKAWKRAIELLEEVGIPNAAKRVHDYPHAFSGGMRQRAMIAMALAMKPAILIADEPTTALDVTVQAQILDLMKKMQNEYKMALILITHNMGVVAETCDDVIVMYAGKPVEIGPVDKIFAAPQHPYTWGLLNSIPKLNRRHERLESIEGQPPNLADDLKGCLFNDRCRFRWQRCQDEEPGLIKDVSGRSCRCWLYDKDSAKSAPQKILDDASKTLALTMP
ncbi:MAG: ABC transporter ATP-binding protein [Elusimicrobiota bacterium]